jgi:tol-pal system protein YbgF
MRVDMRLLGLAFAAGILLHGPAWAQSDTRGLVDRLDRLERDLDALQSQVYRGQGGGGTTVITSPALGGGTTTSGGGAAPGGPIAGDAYSRLDERISALESQLQSLTGQLEKANFSVGQLSAKVDRMQADNDFRFKELETRAGIASPSSAAPPGSPPAAAGEGAAGGPTALVPPAEKGPGSPPGVLVHPQAGAAAAVPPPAVAPPAQQQAALVGRTPQEKYDYAFSLLRNSDYDGATRAFQAFLAQYGQDPLAGNAMFWLGQIDYTQGQYQQAAVTFLDAYRKYPKSAKAGESLLKVGLSMSNLGKKKEACAALQRFSTEYPEAADNLKRQAAGEKQKLGC